MGARYLPRAIEKTLRRAASQFPAVLLSGARQSGKTTLLKRLFARSHRFVSFDLPEIEEFAVRDPNLFLERNPPPIVLDEVQRVPTLLRYIKERIDRKRSTPGQYIMSGSQVFALMKGESESLAGRIAVLDLATMSAGEQDGLGTTWPLPPTGLLGRKDTALSGGSGAGRVLGRMLRGGFPELVVRADVDRRLWYELYVRTYLERDVSSVRRVSDLRDFRRFIVALATRARQLLRLSEVARELGVAVNTVKAWVSVLEASHQIFLLQPYFANLGKRLVRSPKVYFNDTGLLCHFWAFGTRTRC